MSLRQDFYLTHTATQLVDPRARHAAMGRMRAYAQRQRRRADQRCQAMLPQHPCAVPEVLEDDVHLVAPTRIATRSADLRASRAAPGRSMLSARPSPGANSLPRKYGGPS